MFKQLKKMKSKKGFIVIALVFILGLAGFQVSEQQVSEVVDLAIEEKSPSAKNISPTKEFNTASLITSERRVHILYGDATGGGHKFGTGVPCKSEFPEHWEDDRIINEVELIAANDNLNWEQQRNGYYVAEQKIGTVNIRVVKARDAKAVITAYPTNMPRNPCPANDN